MAARSRARWLRPVAVLVALAACGRTSEQPATVTDLAQIRAEHAQWLEHAASSPYRAIVQHPVGPGMTLGPDSADVPLTGLGLYRLEESGATVRMVVDGATRPVWRDRLVALGSYQILVTGLPGRAVATVFGDSLRDYHAPAYYEPSDAWRVEVHLDASTAGATQRLLGPDGSELEATEAGTVLVPAGDTSIALRVIRMPLAGGEESELEIFFRDETNGDGTYPAGRFVSLIPSGGDRYILDFNRARNPFCAYSAVFACPAPWRGNRLPAPVTAGERYSGGGLTAPPG